MNPSLFQQFLTAHADAELWWDAHPDTYESWARKQPGAAFFSPADDSGRITGVTTNPMLVLAALRQGALSAGTGLHDSEAATGQGATAGEAIYERAIVAGARALEPRFEASRGARGWHSAQVPPRCFDDAEAMLAWARPLTERARNIMIKVPANGAGLEALEALVARGTSVNCTLSYTASQARTCLDAIERGRSRAPQGAWRAVITYMSGRFGDHLAREAGDALEPADIRWAELYNAAEQLRIVATSQTATKLLVCSMRLDDAAQSLNGSTCAHLQHLAGHPIVLTCPPPFISRVLAGCAHSRIVETAGALTPPPDVLARLRRQPWFRTGTEPHAIEPAGFGALAPFRENRRQHAEAMAGLDALARAAQSRGTP